MNKEAILQEQVMYAERNTLRLQALTEQYHQLMNEFNVESIKYEEKQEQDEEKKEIMAYEMNKLRCAQSVAKHLEYATHDEPAITIDTLNNILADIEPDENGTIILTLPKSVALIRESTYAASIELPDNCKNIIFIEPSIKVPSGETEEGESLSNLFKYSTVENIDILGFDLTSFNPDYALSVFYDTFSKCPNLKSIKMKGNVTKALIQPHGAIDNSTFIIDDELKTDMEDKISDDDNVELIVEDGADGVPTIANYKIMTE